MNEEKNVEQTEEDNAIVYVNVYAVTRIFGGHEEGGWWYNWYECVECVPCKAKNADMIVGEIEEEHKGIKHGDIYSVLGGVDLRILVEEKRCESKSTEHPVYC